MRYLSAIVEVSALAVLDARQDLALGRGVALELVCHDHPRSISQALQQLAKEPLGCGRAAPALDQDVEDISVLVDRTPKIVRRAADADDEDLALDTDAPSVPVHEQLTAAPGRQSDPYLDVAAGLAVVAFLNRPAHSISRPLIMVSLPYQSRRVAPFLNIRAARPKPVDLIEFRRKHRPHIRPVGRKVS